MVLSEARGDRSGAGFGASPKEEVAAREAAG
jgi:hypothetical protein